jgi:hypothetical protein
MLYRRRFIIDGGEMQVLRQRKTKRRVVFLNPHIHTTGKTLPLEQSFSEQVILRAYIYLRGHLAKLEDGHACDSRHAASIGP